MKFGIMVDAHVGKTDLIQEAEGLGFDRAWVPDSQMIWSDCYVIMALAATRTSRILIGTGVTNPVTRLAPSTANAAASINRLAPGRIFLGIGTGHTAVRVMGQKPASVAAFDDYIRVVRALLDGEEVDYALDGRSAQVQFLHRDRGYLNLDDRVPIFVAANGPRALRVAAARGDGWVTAGGISTALVEDGIQQLRSAAADTGRTLPTDYTVGNMISACILRPGETLYDRRVVDQTGSIVTGNLHFVYEIWEQAGRPDALIPSHFADIWAEYVSRVHRFSLPASSRFRQIHEGHATYLVEEERRFVTPAGIRASCVVGRPEEIVQQLRAMEAVGVTDICLVPPADFQRDIMHDFATEIMPHIG